MEKMSSGALLRIPLNQILKQLENALRFVGTIMILFL